MPNRNIIAPASQDRREAFLFAKRMANLLAPILILLAPMVGFLRYNQYDLWRLEALLSLAPFIIIGLISNALIAMRPATFRPAIIALLLFLFLDLQFRPAEGLWLAAFQDWDFAWRYRVVVVTLATVVVLLALMILTWILRAHLGTILTSVFAVILLATLALRIESILSGESFRRNMATVASLPPVVHIILDGHIGLAGIPRCIRGAESLSEELSRFYKHYGFSLYGRAFSHYTSTYDSLSNLVNGSVALTTGVSLAVAGQRTPQRDIRLRHNLWFRRLSDRGYRIRVYQSDYLNFCDPNEFAIDYCFTAPSNSVHSLMATDLSLVSKLRIILNAYLSGSLGYRIFVRASKAYFQEAKLREQLFGWLWNSRKLGAISAVSALDRMTADLRVASRGTAFFAHVMIPHGAYILDQQCRVKSDIDGWREAYGVTTGLGTVNTQESRAAAYEQYFEQVRCTHRKLAALFETMKSAGIFDNSTIVVHGDHGSRLSLVKPNSQTAEMVSKSDLIDTYSTLFAVRGPEIPAQGNIHGQRSIHSLFAELLLNRPLPEETDDVLIEPSKGRKVGIPFIRHPMPVIGD